MPAERTNEQIRRAGTNDKTDLDITIVVPFYNEEDNIGPLYDDLSVVLRGFGRSYEIIFVDDGSRDSTAKRAHAIAAADPAVRVIELLGNYGQTAAMMAGIDHARGEILVAMDGDGQNDPTDIPRLLTVLDEGYDVVSGWRKDRKDHALTRTLPSQIANRLISAISGVQLHDYGCSLKAYRRSVLKNVRLYGEMHRFIPIYTSWSGGRITELPVQHHPRLRGRSNYGLNRIIKVLLDLLVVMFLQRYLTKPIYLFGGFGLTCLFSSLGCFGWMLWLKVFDDKSFIQTPLPVLTAMLFVTAVLSMLMGLLAEIMVRTYYEAQSKHVYAIRRLTNFD